MVAVLFFTYLNSDPRLNKNLLVEPVLFVPRVRAKILNLDVVLLILPRLLLLLLLLSPTLLFYLLFAITFAFIVSGKQNPAAHDVSLVTPGTKWCPHSTARKHFAVVSMIGTASCMRRWEGQPGINLKKIKAAQLSIDIVNLYYPCSSLDVDS